MSQQIIKGITQDGERFISVADFSLFLQNELRVVQDIKKAAQENENETIVVAYQNKANQLQEILIQLDRLST